MTRRVLVVDDEADIRDAIVEVLRDEGFDAFGARDGRHALDLLAADPLVPDAILLDLRMPVLDGQGFRSEQLKDPRLAAIPVVVISANAQVREVAEQMGAVAHLRKPVDLDALVEACVTHAGRAS